MHGNSLFIAHNLSILPVYNKIYSEKIAYFLPPNFKGYECSIDPDLPIYYKRWVEHIANSFIKEFALIDWVRSNGGVLNMTITEWLSLDLFMREAALMAVNQVMKEQQKNEAQLRSDLEAKIESQKEYKSPFSGVSKPTFIP